MYFRLRNDPERCQKIEVAAFVRLPDMLCIERASSLERCRSKIFRSNSRICAFNASS